MASTGGHLTELVQLAPHIEPDPDKRVWVTFDTQQSRSLLHGERVHFIAFMAPRQWGALVRNFARSLRILRQHRPRQVVSTGAGVALSFLPFGRFFGASATYIESAARVDGPSATGKLIARLPRIATYTQHTNWSDGTWQYGYSVFDSFDPDGELTRRPRCDQPRLFVQLGTLDFPFIRLVQRVAASLPANAEVVWQLGATPPPAALPGRAFDFASTDEIETLIKESTVVVSHAGVGSALMALQNGIRPILVPRSQAHGEHVDDHQLEVARELAARGIATYADVDELDEALLSGDFRDWKLPTVEEGAT
ncbi:glycosyl transferase [Microbacterium faecale]|uniref:Glycosyl transferase n=1 Tax=Microbacterium faecale TaxID=1804630 RepID=A0A916Y6L7_9MICO|nr:glycosyl transferase [Microbacterium faecale]